MSFEDDIDEEIFPDDFFEDGHGNVGIFLQKDSYKHILLQKAIDVSRSDYLLFSRESYNKNAYLYTPEYLCLVIHAYYPHLAKAIPEQN